MRLSMLIVGGALTLLVSASANVVGATPPAAVRIAFIDPLSGAFANAGEMSLRHFRAAFDAANDANRARNPSVPLGAMRFDQVQFEIVGFDSRAQAQEALVQLRLAIDQGFRYVVQGQSSAAALALTDAIAKHNERDPRRAVLFLNYAALDPDLTNSKCNFWHFRFDAHSDMRLEALTAVLARDQSIKSVYLIGQNYSFGQQVSRGAKELLARKRPDIKIVGDDLHPIGQVKDFAPYAAKIKASGAHAIITGNWGNDLALLVRAAREAGVGATFYTFYAGSLGAVTAIGAAGADRVKQVNEWHSNVPSRELERYAERYSTRFREDFYFQRINTLTEMLAAAIAQARSAEPLAVAQQLAGMRYRTPLGDVEMRASDHQLIQPLFVSTLAPVGSPGVRYDVEKSGMGFRTDARIDGYVTAQPTSCVMTRPHG